MEDEGSILAKFVRIVTTLIILTAGVGGLAVMMVMGKPAPPTAKPETIGAPLVATALVAEQRDHLDIRVDGVVVPFREIAVAAEVGGQILQKADVCEAGKYVRKGTLLIKIDPRDYEYEVRRLEKELEQAVVKLRELDVDEENTTELIALAQDGLALQKKEVTRLEQLAKQGKNYVTESAIDGERRNELTARNALVTLENQRRTLQARRDGLTAARGLVEANLDKARLNLTRTQITSPVDGMVVQDLVEADGYVAPGAVVVRIEDVSQCDVRCNLRMDELDWIWRQPARTTAVEYEPGSAAHDYSLPPTPTTVIYRLGDRRYEWDGVLTRYDGIGLDETTRTVPCIVVVEQPTRVREAGADASVALRGPRALVRGMYVDLVIHAQPHLALLEVPEQAIQPGNKVLRVQDGKLNIIPVQVVSVMNGRAVIRVKQRAPLVSEKDKPLRPDDQVVITPPADIEEDMPVRVESEGGR